MQPMTSACKPEFLIYVFRMGGGEQRTDDTAWKQSPWD